MSQISENVRTLMDTLEHPSKRLEALGSLMTIGTPEAIKIIIERARDPLELLEIRYSATKFLRKKGIMY
jgi:HEAT repeat protein